MGDLLFPFVDTLDGVALVLGLSCWLALLLADRLDSMIALESLGSGLRALQVLQAEFEVLLVGQRCALSFLKDFAPFLAAILARKL